MDIPDSFGDIHLSIQLALISTDIPWGILGNIPRLARTLKALSNPGIFLGISVEKNENKKVLAGLREGYP